MNHNVICKNNLLLFVICIDSSIWYFVLRKASHQMYNLYLSYKKPNFQMTAETAFVDHSYSLLLLPTFRDDSIWKVGRLFKHIYYPLLYIVIYLPQTSTYRHSWQSFFQGIRSKRRRKKILAFKVMTTWHTSLCRSDGSVEFTLSCSCHCRYCSASCDTFSFCTEGKCSVTDFIQVDFCH